MAIQDLNNSYWAQKLYQFREGIPLFPARQPGSGNGSQTAEVEIPVPLRFRCNPPVFIGGLALLVVKYSARDDVLIAEHTAGESGKLSPLFYRCEIQMGWPVDSFLACVDAEIQKAHEHQPYSFEGVATLLSLKEESIFRIGFSAASSADPDSLMPREGMFLRVSDDGSTTRLVFSYDARYYSQNWMRQFAQHYLRVLSFLTGDRSARLSEFSLLSSDEQHSVAAQFNHTERDYPADKTLHGLLEERAATAPNSVAVIFENEELTYRDLNEKANRLAHFLRDQLNVRRGDIVGLMLKRSETMVIAMLAIMKAGAAYVPINSKHPWATLSYMIENSGIRVLLVDTDSVSQAATFAGDLFIVDVELDLLDTAVTNPVVESSASDLAYVIYTSGSTGRPKGVAIQHRAIVNTILWRNEYYGLNQSDVNLQMPSFAFDSSVVDIFCVLCAGGRLLIPDEELRLDARYLKATILKHGATRLILTPGYYRVLMRELSEGTTLRSITVAGEATTVELVEEHSRRMPGVVLYNEYGPTENAVCSTACVLRAGNATVPIGKPISNVKVFILGEDLKLLPPGVPGEIFLGGRGLAQGYLNQEALTAERFIQSPIPGIYSGRLYRTGDWGYWRDDGVLEFLGRVDNQVKVRGFRIELGEIENRLSHHPEVESAAVVCKREGEDKYLAAYVVSRNSLTTEELRSYLSDQLPYYMIPEVISFLSELPLTFNGKVNRALLKGINDRTGGDCFDLPEDGMESALATVCSGLLQRGRLGANDNFFDHGLNSLRVMEMVSRIRNELEVDVSLLDIYTFPTIKSLSRRIGVTRWKPEFIQTESTT
ncbi:MAG TPA: non-ribosomal peptide synthetase [Blastocatellia bacterium]|nr:non-ribosomal peptide synthetase [Blastocatellia bacterium]